METFFNDKFTTFSPYFFWTEINAFFDAINDQCNNNKKKRVCDTVSLVSDHDSGTEQEEDEAEHPAEQQNEQNENAGNDGQGEAEEEDADFQTAQEETMEENVGEQLYESMQSNENDDEGNQNVQPQGSPNDKGTQVLIQQVGGNSMEPKVSMDGAKSNSSPNLQTVATSIVEPRASSVSDPGPSNDDNRKKCFRCNELFLKESTLLTHLKYDHNVNLTPENDGDEPGKFVRAPKRKLKAASDDDDQEIPSQDLSPRISPMKSVLKRFKKNKH